MPPYNLPTVGGDDNSWGTMLNNYLGVSHTADGGTYAVKLLTNSSSPYSISSESPPNPNEVFLANCSSGAITVTLPDATSINFNQNVYTVKKTDSSSNAVTINTTSSQTIDGSTSATIYLQYVSIGLVSDGSNWNVI